MPSQKRDRQWVSTRAKAAALEAAKRQRMRRRLGAAVAVGVLILAIVGAAALVGGGSNSKTAAATSTTVPGASLVSTTTTAPLASAAGKPCLALSEPLPTGAPDVPVKVGPPPTALVSEDLKPGDGAVVAPSNTLTVNYIGVSCSTGKIFDSSFKSGQPASFPLANVIQGWQQGLVGMKVGGQRLLGIPPALAYGSAGRPGIAPDETLWFVVDLVAAK